MPYNIRKIEEIDPNFASKRPDETGLVFYDPCRAPFAVYGLCAPQQGRFERMPAETAESIGKWIDWLNTNTAGGRIRFRTESKRILLRWKANNPVFYPHMPATGSSLFDLYTDGTYMGPFLSSPAILDPSDSLCYSAVKKFKTEKMREIQIHFPLYGGITTLEIGLEEGAAVEAGEPYAHSLPVVYYGSSITQGGCASHPGNSYQAMLERETGYDYINLGFSGNCKAEDAMCDYISALPMAAFVYDYDHNAPNAEYLEMTHERFFRRFREKQPETPVLMITRADYTDPEEEAARTAIIRKTYDDAVAAGDRNVWFLDGSTIYAEVGRDLCTVDCTHPNDLGFWCMAKAILPYLKKMLKIV